MIIILIVSATSEEEKCQRPFGNSCTDATSDETKAAGLGVYYEYPCIGVGCNFNGPSCRLCAKHHLKINRPYPKCPDCVPGIEELSEKAGHENPAACQLPHGNSCTDATSDETKAAGLGVYYEYPCIGIGCNFYRPFCRLCAKHPLKIGRPYSKCPECVV
ncbi:unnamed protein product [Adineta steineri]|uniref:Uncharacterized protein n=3 Tax=Adineta steineri TaxID=433720 RepID=A0A819YQG9_9BILA|nr:unnamed protein product [Adineta steineri]CAF1085457.1 unnamed protein product [Adineta steineri]CAF4159314.1 unnamed protein product [Adineta steineri]